MQGRIVALLAVLAIAPRPLSAGNQAPSPGAGESAPAPVATIDAVWVEVERSFVYFSQTTYYSCHGLRDKVRYVLESVGARPDLKVTIGCFEPSRVGVELLPSLRIKAAFPAEATPGRLAQIEQDASRRELVARVQGRSADEDVARFPAAWRRVEFNGRSARGRIDDGDCELLEQLIDSVLEPAGVQVVEGSRLSCMRGQIPIGAVRLVLDTLQKVPEPDEPPPAR